MQSRCTLIVAAHGRRPFRRGVICRRLLTTQKSLPRLYIHVGYYPGHMRTAFRRRSYHSSQIVLEPRSLHSSSRLSIQAGSTIENEDDEDEYVAAIASSHLSELFKDDIYETQEVSHDWPSLDDELGETSIWDTSLDEEDEESVDYLDRLKRSRRQAPKRSASEMLLHFDPQCPPQSDNFEDLELWLECEAQRESVLKYQNVIDSARERRDYDSLSMVQKQILNWYLPLKNAIEEEQEVYMTKSKFKKDMNRYGPFLCALQPQKLSVILAHESIMHTLQRGINGVTLASLALRIGSAIEAEVNVQRALQQRLEESSQGNRELNLEELMDDIGDKASQTDNASLSGLPPEQESDDIVNRFGDWMYGPSHLQRFIDEAHSLDPSKKTRIRISHANRRARRILKSDEEWRKSEMLKLGVALIEILLQNAMIDQNGQQEKAFSYEKRYLTKDKFVGRIYLHEKLYKMVLEDSWESLEASTTRYKPMILPPRDWVAPDDGGYSWLKVDLMRTHGSKLQKVNDLSCIPTFCFSFFRPHFVDNFYRKRCLKRISRQFLMASMCSGVFRGPLTSLCWTRHNAAGETTFLWVTSRLEQTIVFHRSH